MSQKLQVVEAFDRALVTEIPADDSHALETKLGSAARSCSSPHCHHERGDSDNPHSAFQIVSKNEQTHFGTHAPDRFGQEVSRTHPCFDRAEGVLAGKIVERLVDPGQTVHKGQPLMRIDPVDYDLASGAAPSRQAGDS